MVSPSNHEVARLCRLTLRQAQGEDRSSGADKMDGRVKPGHDGRKKPAPSVASSHHPRFSQPARRAAIELAHILAEAREDAGRDIFHRHVRQARTIRDAGA